MKKQAQFRKFPVRQGLQGEPSPLGPGLGRFAFGSSDTARADESLAEWVEQLGKKGETIISKSTQPRSAR